jgi:hypothetical protein
VIDILIVVIVSCCIHIWVHRCTSTWISTVHSSLTTGRSHVLGSSSHNICKSIFIILTVSMLLSFLLVRIVVRWRRLLTHMISIWEIVIESLMLIMFNIFIHLISWFDMSFLSYISTRFYHFRLIRMRSDNTCWITHANILFLLKPWVI